MATGEALSGLPLPIQLYLPMFTQHEIDAWTYQDQQRLERYLQRQQKKLTLVWVDSSPGKTKAIDDASDALLDASFGQQHDLELSDLGDPYGDSDMQGGGDPAADPEHAEASETLVEPAVSWSESAIELLHENLFHYSLRLLNTRGNGKEKKEILRWVFNPSAIAVAKSESPDVAKVWEFIKPQDVPFGFELCSRFAGYDPERVREGLVPVLKNLGLEAIYKEITDDHTDQQGRVGEIPAAGVLQPA
jgi:hypothetical protein